MVKRLIIFLSILIFFVLSNCVNKPIPNSNPINNIHPKDELVVKISPNKSSISETGKFKVNFQGAIQERRNVTVGGIKFSYIALVQEGTKHDFKINAYYDQEEYKNGIYPKYNVAVSETTLLSCNPNFGTTDIDGSHYSNFIDIYAYRNGTYDVKINGTTLFLFSVDDPPTKLDSFVSEDSETAFNINFFADGSDLYNLTLSGPEDRVIAECAQYRSEYFNKKAMKDGLYTLKFSSIMRNLSITKTFTVNNCNSNFQTQGFHSMFLPPTPTPLPCLTPTPTSPPCNGNGIFTTQGFKIKGTSNNLLLPSDLSSIKSASQQLSDTVNTISNESINNLNQLNNQIANIISDLSNLGFTVQSAETQKQRKIQELQDKLAAKKAEREIIIQQINNVLTNIDSQKTSLRSAINRTIGNNVSVDSLIKPVDLQGYKDKISGFAVDFTNKVNSGNTFSLAGASNVIADETQLLSNLTKDYLDDRLANIPPATDTEDLTRFEMLVKPNQLIKYLRNQIKNHNDKFPKEVQQLENKIDNSITKTTAKLTKIQADLENIKTKYNLSFTTNSFHTNAVDASGFANINTLQTNIAVTIDSIGNLDNQSAIDAINNIIPNLNNISSDFNNTQNSCSGPCNQSETILIALKPPARPKYNPSKLPPKYDPYNDCAGISQNAREKNSYMFPLILDNDMDGPFLAFVMIKNSRHSDIYPRALNPRTGQELSKDQRTIDLDLNPISHVDRLAESPGVFLDPDASIPVIEGVSTSVIVTAKTKVEPNQQLLLSGSATSFAQDDESAAAKQSRAKENEGISKDTVSVKSFLGDIENPTNITYLDANHKYKKSIEGGLISNFNKPSEYPNLSKIEDTLLRQGFDSGSNGFDKSFYVMGINLNQAFNELAGTNNSKILNFKLGTKNVKFKLSLDKDNRWVIECP